MNGSGYAGFVVRGLAIIFTPRALHF